MPGRLVGPVRRHPFLSAFLALALWNSVTSTAGYISNQHRIDDIQKLRAQRAALVSETDVKLCRGQNKIRTQIRQVVFDDKRTASRLGLPAGTPVTGAYIRQVAQSDGNASEYARRIVVFLDRFADVPCKRLPSQTLTPKKKTGG